MFSLFRKKSELEVLSDRYRKLLQESHRLSKVNRIESDLKFAEAMAVQDQLDQLKND